MMLEEGKDFLCPYCGAENTIILEMSEYTHDQVSDCEICCNPMHINYKYDGEKLENFEVMSLEQ